MEKNQIPSEKFVVEVRVPQTVFDELMQGMKKIDRMEKALETMKVFNPTEWLLVEEFLTKTKVSRWMFEAWKDAGTLNIRKIGRKWYVHPEEVRRYFDGELTLKE